MPKGYKGVTIPEALASEIQHVIDEHPEYGYASLAEFMKDAARRLIQEIREK